METAQSTGDTTMSDKTKQAAEAVTKWLDGGASTWGYPESQIRHLATVAPDLLAMLRAAIEVQSTIIDILAPYTPTTIDGMRQTMAEFEAVVAKAEGRS